MRQSQGSSLFERYADLRLGFAELEIFNETLPQSTQSDETSSLFYSSVEVSLGSIVGC